MEGQYTATLKGGLAGVQALDGRTMGGDYSWSFAMQPYKLRLPMIKK